MKFYDLIVETCHMKSVCVCVGGWLGGWVAGCVRSAGAHFIPCNDKDHTVACWENRVCVASEKRV